jgi:hypothetical protein
MSLRQDGIFSDDASLQIASVTGELDRGYAATLRVGVAARPA